MPETTHHGSCHCGAVQYRVDLDLSQPAITCNCSMCGRTGSMLAFVPTSKFTLETGSDAMTDYQFGKRNIHHLFCSTCGIRSFGRGTGPDGTEMIAINVRCLDKVELDQVSTHSFDGRSL